MKTYIALFRGINVGGRNSLPMKELVAVLERFGCADVATYVQSGNAVFRHDPGEVGDIGARIRTAIGAAKGFAPEVLILTNDQLEVAVAANPFPEATKEPKSLHLSFLAAEPQAPDLESLDALRVEGERFVLGGRVFYLHAPAGIGRSKLAAQVERKLGVSATARNWRSTVRILDLARRSG